MSKCSWPRCACKATGVYCSEKPASGPKPRKAIPRQTAKGRQKKIEKGMLTQTDAAMYLEIWQERPHVDFETGDPIYGEFSLLYFHHVLPKRPDGGYPQYRHCKWNIVMLNWNTHDQAESDMDKTPKVRAYYKKLLGLHDAGKLANLNPNLHSVP